MKILITVFGSIMGETEAGVRLEEENPGTRVEFYIPMRREE